MWTFDLLLCLDKADSYRFGAIRIRVGDLDRNASVLALCVIVGGVVAYASGFFPSPLSYVLVGVAQWGIPLPWITQAIYPNAPKVFSWETFLVDVGFWALVSFLGYSTINKRRRSKTSYGVFLELSVTGSKKPCPTPS